MELRDIMKRKIILTSTLCSLSHTEAKNIDQNVEKRLGEIVYCWRGWVQGGGIHYCTLYIYVKISH
jgi:hypothetical protein